MKYKRILLKLSGESLMGNQQYGIDTETLNYFATEISTIKELGAEVGVVIGGGNIFRGMQGVGKGFDRVQGDYMGMLATVINSMALQSALESLNIPTAILSGISIDPICNKISRRSIQEQLNLNKVVIMSSGTGNPYFTTDSGAALRGIEMEADILLKATRVDGIYSADPEKDKTATKFNTLTFDEAYQKNLNIMDMTAFTLCRENNLKIIVFDINKKGNLKKIILGEQIGTIVNNK